MTAYTFKCRCGRTSPGFDSKQKSKAWHRRHVREDCAIRRPATGLSAVDANLKRRLAWARSLKPLPLPEQNEPGPQFAYYWENNGRFSALRRIAIPEPVKTDSWGRPIR